MIVGRRTRLTFTNRDPAGALANGTVTCTATRPDGTTAAVSVVNDGTGLYHGDLDLDAAGRWTWLFTSTGAVVNAGSGVLNVTPATPGALISLDEAKAQINLTVTTSDEEITDFLEAITSDIEQYVGAVVSRACDEWHDGGSWLLIVDQAPIIAVTAVTEVYGSYSRTLTAQPLGAGALDAFGYTVDLASGELTRRSVGQASNFAPGRRNIHVTYTAGRAVIPAAITFAARLIFQHQWMTQRGASMRAGQGGTDTVQLPGWSYAIPTRAAEKLESFAKPPGIA